MITARLTGWSKGVSTFNEQPEKVGSDHLAPLLRHALDVVPKHAVRDTPFFLLATAGMRLLPEGQRKALLERICSYVRLNTDFLLPDCNLHVQVIPGETEGLYGWVAANYLLGGFDSPNDHDHGNGHHTYGFLDMGGASAQIAFAPNATEAEKHADDLKLLRMRTLNGESMEYRVFVTTWLGFGVHQARRRYVEALLEASATHDARELPDPCLPVGLTATRDGHVLEPGSEEAKRHKPYLIGTGRFDECLRQTYPLLDKDAPCEDHPCLLHGVHVPAIDFDVNHFVGVSEYWHTTHEIFEMAHKDKAYDFNTYQKRVRDFCGQDWKTISDRVRHQAWGKKVDERTAIDVCFKASWLINVLHDGIGIPRVGLENTKTNGVNGTKEVIKHAKEKGYLDPFQAVDKVQDVEVSWTLGKMVLYATSQIPADRHTLPVGFGSNEPGVPHDFQHAGTRHALGGNATMDADADDGGPSWRETILDSDSPRRIPGFLLFLCIIGIGIFIWCGRDRRSKLYRRVRRSLGRPGSPKRRRVLGGKLFGVVVGGSTAPATYERLLEDGDRRAEFELGGVDSDNEYSDSSDSNNNNNNNHRVGRSSGWATPQLKVALDKAGQTSYFDHHHHHHGPITGTGAVAGTRTGTVGLGIGLGAPQYFGGNAMNRSGLVVRTESRDRLFPHIGGGCIGGSSGGGMSVTSAGLGVPGGLGGGLGLGPPGAGGAGVAGAGAGAAGGGGAGRRSRAGSPVRPHHHHKSPLMTPLADDYD